MIDLEGYEILDIFGLEGKLVLYSQLNNYFHNVLIYGNLKWDFSIYEDGDYLVVNAEKQEPNVNNEKPNDLVKWIRLNKNFYFCTLAKQTHMLIGEQKTRGKFREIFATNKDEVYYEIEEHNGNLYTYIYVPKDQMIYDYAHLGISVVVYLENELYSQMVADEKKCAELFTINIERLS